MTINDEHNHEVDPNIGNQSILINKANDQYDSIEKLATTGCFGPFPSCTGITSPIGPSPTLDPLSYQNMMSRYEAGNSVDKWRRIANNSCTEHPSRQLSFDLNSPNLIPPEQVPLPDSPDLVSPIDETVEIGQILGFEIDIEDPILTEVMDEASENHMPQ